MTSSSCLYFSFHLVIFVKVCLHSICIWLLIARMIAEFKIFAFLMKRGFIINYYFYYLHDLRLLINRFGFHLVLINCPHFRLVMILELYELLEAFIIFTLRFYSMILKLFEFFSLFYSFMFIYLNFY